MEPQRSQWRLGVRDVLDRRNQTESLSLSALTYKVGAPADGLVSSGVNLGLSEAEERPGQSLDQAGPGLVRQLRLGETARGWGEAGSDRREK